MEKTIILDAYNRGLLSKEEFTKLLEIVPNTLNDEPFKKQEIF